MLPDCHRAVLFNDVEAHAIDLYGLIVDGEGSTLSYEVRLVYQNFPDWFGRSNAPTRPFFAQDTGTEPITIGFLTLEAKNAGLEDGDELVAINGKPVVGTAVFGEAMRAAGVGDILYVVVRRGGQLHTTVVTLRGGGHHDLVWLLMKVLLIVVAPVLSLGIGFWVAFVRPRDPVAVFYNADAEQWGPVVRDLAVIYRLGLDYAFPIVALLFGLYFPEPFPRQGRWLWWYRLAWLLIVPSVLLGAAGVVDGVATMENRAAVMGLDRLLAALGTALPSLLVFACSLPSSLR